MQAADLAEPETKRVLIVDDDTAVLRIMREALHTFCTGKSTLRRGRNTASSSP